MPVANILVVAAVFLGGTVGAATPARHAAPVVGVTVDDVSHLHRTVASLRHLPTTPWIREVLDVDHARPASLGPYVRTTRRLAAVSHVMAELVDSSALRRITADQLAHRTSRYLEALRNRVDLWEIGNEVNGDWTGRAATVARKVRNTYRQVHAAGGRTALTLYENQHCGDGPGELSPTAWSRRYLSAKIRAGLDDVLLSYYEPQCHGVRPSARTWTERFRALHHVFPDARLGFGEIGMPRPATAHTTDQARSIIRYYYGLRLPLPYFIGGDFYWYYVEDMTPWAHSPLWHTLRAAVAQP